MRITLAESDCSRLVCPLCDLGRQSGSSVRDDVVMETSDLCSEKRTLQTPTTESCILCCLLSMNSQTSCATSIMKKFCWCILYKHLNGLKKVEQMQVSEKGEQKVTHQEKGKQKVSEKGDRDCRGLGRIFVD